jgi:hypothetical protein
LLGICHDTQPCPPPNQYHDDDDDDDDEEVEEEELYTTFQLMLPFPVPWSIGPVQVGLLLSVLLYDVIFVPCCLLLMMRYYYLCVIELGGERPLGCQSPISSPWFVVRSTLK